MCTHSNTAHSNVGSEHTDNKLLKYCSLWTSIQAQALNMKLAYTEPYFNICMKVLNTVVSGQASRHRHLARN